MISYKSPTGFSVINGAHTVEYSIRLCTPLSNIVTGFVDGEFQTHVDSAIKKMVAKLNKDYKLKGAKR